MLAVLIVLGVAELGALTCLLADVVTGPATVVMAIGNMALLVIARYRQMRDS